LFQFFLGPPLKAATFMSFSFDVYKISTVEKGSQVSSTEKSIAFCPYKEGRFALFLFPGSYTVI
jgi:hypothetical protein